MGRGATVLQQAELRERDLVSVALMSQDPIQMHPTKHYTTKPPGAGCARPQAVEVERGGKPANISVLLQELQEGVRL